MILGAGSDMAMALILELFAKWANCHFCLLARNTSKLEKLKTEAAANNHKVDLYTYDLEHPTDLHFSGIQYAITFAGWLPPDNTEPEKAMLINHTAIQLFLEGLIKDNNQTLEQIMITGSIAGVRVRPSNMAYGQAKAALHQYAYELQKRHPNFVTTLVIPGYVKTRMLEGLSTPGALTLSVTQMAEKYLLWLETKPKTAYSQPAWRIIGLILRMIPSFILKRMKM